MKSPEELDALQRRMRGHMASDCNCPSLMGAPMFPHSKWCRTRVLSDAYHAIMELRAKVDAFMRPTR